MRKEFSPLERTAIAELVTFGGLCGTSTNEAVKAIGALACERAANIVRGEVSPHWFTDADVVEFAATWKTDERAQFNPKPKRVRTP